MEEYDILWWLNKKREAVFGEKWGDNKEVEGRKEKKREMGR